MLKRYWVDIVSVAGVAAGYLLLEFILAPKVMLSAGVLLIGGLVLWRLAPADRRVDPRTIIVP